MAGAPLKSKEILPPPKELTRAKRKGKIIEVDESSYVEIEFPLSIESLLFYFSLCDESEVKELPTETFFAFEDLFDEEAITRVRGKVSDITLFDMAAMVKISSVSPPSLLFFFCSLHVLLNRNVQSLGSTLLGLDPASYHIA